MRIAFSTAAVGGWDLSAALACAKRLGVDGLELDTPPEDATLAARMAGDAGVTLACLKSAAIYAGNRTDDLVSGAVVRADIDAAREMGCRVVRVADMAPTRAAGKDLIRFGDYLMPLAEHARQAGVALALENGRALRTARPMWEVIDRVGNAGLGVCWNAASAAGAGENPWRSVPMLNSMIRYVRVGEREMLVRSLIARLKGVGYEGVLSLAYEDASEELLAVAAARLREWVKGPVAKAVKPQASAKA